MKTIRQQLLLWLLTGTLLCLVIAGSILFFKIREEASELCDALLKQVASTVPIPLSIQAIDNDSIEPEEKVLIQIWDEKQQLNYTSDVTVGLPLYPKSGFKTVRFHNEEWRTYSRRKQNLIVQIAQPTIVWQTLAAKIALRSLFPLLILIPILAGLIWVVVGRSLKPLLLFTDAVKRRSPEALQPLALDGLSPEVIPVCHALNELLAKLDQSLSKQRAFIADAAHELRTPLAALKLQLQLVERTHDETQRQVGLEKLHERLDRANHLVHQLLTLARHEPGAEKKPQQELELRLLAEQVIIDFYPLALSKKIELGLDADPMTPNVMGNSEDLRILLNNIVDNAVRYTPEGGKVDMLLRYADNHVILKVIDNGPGIAQQDRLRVFDRFYRCEANETLGSGLGLSIAKNIVDMHAATLTLGNNPLESGLMVSISFAKTKET